MRPALRGRLSTRTGGDEAEEGPGPGRDGGVAFSLSEDLESVLKASGEIRMML